MRSALSLPPRLLILLATFNLSGGAGLFAAAPFHENLLARGKADYNVANYARAAEELRIAAFGFLDDLQAYEITQVYLTLAYDKLAQKEDALKAITEMLEAERIAPTYGSLPLPAPIRAEFDRVASTLLPAQKLLPFSRPVTRIPDPVSAVPAPMNAPAKQLSPSDALRKLVRDDPTSVPLRAALAEAMLEEDEEAEAARIAGEVLIEDPSNTTANLVMGRIAARHGNARDTVQHFVAVPSRSVLTDKDLADLFVAYVTLREFDSASELKDDLSGEQRERADVRDALGSLESETRRINLAEQRAKAAEQKAAEQNAAEQKAAEQKAAEQKAAEQKAAEQRAAEQKAAEQKAAEQRAAEQRAAEQKAAEQKAAAHKEPPAESTIPPAEKARKTERSTVSPEAGPTSTTGAAAGAPTDPARALLADAERSLAEGEPELAREIYLQLSKLPNLTRPQMLQIARGLTRTSSFAEANAMYEKAGRLIPGDEVHLFYKAILLYEEGNYARARQYLALALPHVPMTPEVVEYKAKIWATAPN